ncbi:MAG: hypothetical protein HRU20_00075 [Pseudomonadales bacterium]|nr:hypothetical protein [Pseudomonadales bacterium]
MLISAVFLIQPPAIASDNSWLGDDYRPNSIIARIGEDESSRLTSLETQFNLINYHVFQARYTQVSHTSAAQELDIEQYLLAFSSDPMAIWSLSTRYEYSGDKDTLTAKEVELSLQYAPAQWLIAVGYQHAAIEIVLARKGFTLPVQRDGASVFWQLSLDSWLIDVSASAYRYDRDLSGFNQPRRSSNNRQSSLLTQVFSLLDWHVSTTLSHHWSATMLELGLVRYFYTVTQTASNQVMSQLNYQLTDAMSLGAQLSTELDDVVWYSELSLGYHW